MKAFLTNCKLTGSFLAHHATPKFMHPVMIPLLSVTLGPIASAALCINDARYNIANRRELKKHKEIGPHEKSIRAIFGDISLQGNSSDIVRGVEMDFEDVKVIDVFPRQNRVSVVSRDMLHAFSKPTREECAQHLLGRLAYYASFQDAARAQERYIAVRKKGDLGSTFYTASKAAQNAPDSAPHSGAIQAVYEDHHGFNHYVISKVDEDTAQRLSDMGL